MSCVTFWYINQGLRGALAHNIPAMIASGGGAIVTIASQLAVAGGRNNCAYVASKGAVISLTRAAARELGGGGVRVNALSAGPMRTLSGAGVSDARVIFNFQRENSPLKRTPSLDDVGGSALYLLSPMSGAVTGEVHFVDCGYNTVSMPNLQNLKEIDSDGGSTSRSPSEAAE